MRDKMSPSDADDKVKEIIDNPPEKKTVGHLLFEILRLTLLANSNLRLPERLQTSVMQSRANIRKFLDKNYNYSTVQNIFRIFDDAMDSGKIPVEDSVNHLIQIATKETAYQERRKKGKNVDAIEMNKNYAPQPRNTLSQPQGRNQFTNNNYNNNAQYSQNMQTGNQRCHNCNMEPRDGGRFNHNKWRDCPFYRDNNNMALRPNMNQQPCRCCGGHHTGRCQKEMRLTRGQPSVAPSSRRSYGPQNNYQQGYRNFNNQGPRYNNYNNQMGEMAITQLDPMRFLLGLVNSEHWDTNSQRHQEITTSTTNNSQTNKIFNNDFVESWSTKIQ